MVSYQQDPLFSLPAAGAPPAGKLPPKRPARPFINGRRAAQMALRDRLLLQATVILGEFAPGMSSECWIRSGGSANGYSVITRDGRSRLAHRVAYELWFGPIPSGLTVDHLCCVRRCVNPDHLETVERIENTRRAMLRWAFKPAETLASTHSNAVSRGHIT